MLLLRSIRLATREIPLSRAFKFGVVELRSLTHLELDADFTLGPSAALATGYAAENLAPKWFEKNPAFTPEQDVARLLETVRATCRLALDLPPKPTAYDFYLALRAESDAAFPHLPALVRQLAVSLLERAAIDAVCRHHRTPFHLALPLLGWHGTPARPASGLGPTSAGSGPADVGPGTDPPAMARRPLAGEAGLVSGGLSAPPRFLHVRHTVGLSDPASELPALLGESGVRRLKVKLSGDVDADLTRLRALHAAFPAAEVYTLDGNENYPAADALEELLSELRSSPALEPVRERLAWVEQPLRRDVALGDDVEAVLRRHADIPHLLDESDAAEGDLARALALGYAGTTHKNCKGVFKSLRAAASGCLLSGEDLTIVSPLSMAQDLAVAAAVGVVDIERNGHHYAGDLSALPTGFSAAAATLHPDLYPPAASPRAPRLHIARGRLDLASVNTAPALGTLLTFAPSGRVRVEL